MADKISGDPVAAQNLNRLVAAMQAKQAELEQILVAARQSVSELGTVTTQEIALQEEQARTLAVQRPPGAGSIQEATAAVRQQAAAEDEVNAAIIRQIELQARAAAAARSTAQATTGGTLGAAKRVEAASTGTPAQIEAQAAALRQAQAAQVSGAAATGGVMGAAGRVQQTVESSEAASAAARVAQTRQAATQSTAGLAQAEKQLAVTTQASIGGQENLAAAQSRYILQGGQLDNALQRHGALTTEFIGAAARGEVTLREFGDQIGQTIGKFAGWTLAAGAVYGVIGGLTEIAKGAIDADNSVQQLTRTVKGVSAGQATAAIVSLAHETNTSMKEAGDAVFAFSRTFHNVDDAARAAGLALKAEALDGVSIADQVKMQTALHQQFGISVAGMKTVYDQLAAGQREWNARVTEQTPILQRSASAVKNAGGDLTQLIELSTIALRTTQLSGAQVGTAFSRSAAIFLSPTTHQGQTDRAILQSLGIDPNRGYTQVVFDALKKAPSLSPQQISELSHAIFGSLRGGLMAGMFTGGPQISDAVIKSIKDSKGSFAEEFAKELGTSRQELKALVNDVQQLGGALANSGLLTPLGVVVRGLGDALHISSELLQTWDKLPGPVKEVAGLMAGLAAARAIGQHFNVPIPGLGPTQASQESKQLTVGLAEQSAFYTQQVQAATRNAAVAGSVATGARAQLAAAETTGDAKAIERAEASLAKSETAQAEAGVKAEAMATEMLAAQNAELEARMLLAKGLSAQAVAAQIGQPYMLGTLEKGSGLGGVMPTAAGASKAEAAAGSAAASTAEQAALDAQAASATQMASSAEVTAGKVGAAEVASTGAGVSLSGVTGSVSKFLPAIFAVGLGVAGVTGAFGRMSDANKQLNQLLAQVPTTFAEAQQQLVTAQDLADKAYKANLGAGGFGSFASGIGLGAPVRLVQSALGIDASLNNPEGQVADALKALLAPIATQKETVLGTGPPVSVGRGPTQLPTTTRDVTSGGEWTTILDDAKKDAANVKNTAASRAQWAEEEASLLAAARQAGTHIEELKNKSPQVVAAVENVYQGLKATMDKLNQGVQAAAYLTPIPSTGDPFAQFRGQDPKQLVTQMQAVADHIKLFGPDDTSMKELATAYTFIANKVANSRDDTELQAAMQAQSLFVDTVKKSAQDLIDQADVAPNKATKLSDLREASQIVEKGIKDLRDGEVKTAAEVAGLRARYAVDDVAMKLAAATSTVADDVVAKGLIQHAGTVGFFGQAIAKGIGNILKGADLMNLVTKGLQGVVATDKAAGDAAAKALAGLTAADKVAQQQLDAILKSINSATVATTKTPKTPASQDPFELARLRGEIAKAQAEGDPVKQAQADEQFAQVELAGARNEHEKLQAQLDMINAENAYNKAVEDRTQAFYTYLESTTRDPILQASDALKAATDAVAYATAHGGTGTQDYYDAKAKQNDAKNKLADAHLQRSEDNIQFGLDLNQISVQTAINEYEQLLKLHNLTLQQRQDLKRKIYDLQKGTSSDFSDLNLGTIKLPTPYEIRRGVMAAQAGIAVTSQYSTTINVYDERGAAAVGVQMDRYQTGVGKAISRARGFS